MFDNDTLGKLVHAVCDDNKQCLFDIYTTGKVSIGKASKQALESFFAVISETETPGKLNLFKKGKGDKKKHLQLFKDIKIFLVNWLSTLVIDIPLQAALIKKKVTD